MSVSVQYGSNADKNITSQDFTKVSKYGDTMTGDLSVTTDNAPTIVIKNTDMDSAAQSLANAEYSYLFFDDVNNAHMALIYAGEESSGRNLFRLRCRKVVNGADVNHGVFLRIANNGSREVIFDDAGAWLTGLGLGSVSSTTTASDVISAGTGITISAVVYSSWGKLAMLGVEFSYNSSISTTKIDVGTLKSGKRPTQYANWIESTGRTVGDITTGGVIRVRVPVGGSSVAANTTVTMRAVYLLA